MWNALSLQMAIHQNSTIKDRIILEEIPSAHIYLDSILRSVRENRAIEFSYWPFGKDPIGVALYPYFMQMSDQRWYVHGINPYGDRIKSYALDRIQSLTIQEETFILPKDFFAEVYLSGQGIGQYEKIPVVNVVLQAYGRQIELLRTLPLHQSQKETKTEDGRSEFTYTLRPTTKFYGDILSAGKYI
ncbi:MAG: WYL domain-containing protein, partial [Bacteroides sp.]|nr:WYL domain-containing protein [Bacteroides sp.]